MLTVVGERVGVGDGIIAATGAEPQVEGISVLVTLNVDVGVTPVDLTVDYLLLHLAGRHERVGAYLEEVVDATAYAVAVLDVVAALTVHLLPLGDHLTHGLHEQRHTTVPGRNQKGAAAIRLHYVGLPVGTTWLLVLGCVRVSG